MTVAHCGTYLVVGVLAARCACAATNYVWQANPTPAAPYTSWATAANAIQPAVDAALPGALVLVTNGVYATGGRPAPGQALTNRVLILGAIAVQSVNGREVTTIVGSGPNNAQAVRCAYLGHSGAQLTGFTLTNGHSGTSAGQSSGGGVYVTAGVVSACRIAGCNGYIYGGGAYCDNGGTLTDCEILNNDGVAGGGVYCMTNGAVLNSVIAGNDAENGGGGAFLDGGGLVSNCTVRNNSVMVGFSGGGGVACLSGGTVLNSIVASNTINGRGGGIHGDGGSVVRDCVIVGNAATNGGGIALISGGHVQRCQIVANTAAESGGGVDASISMAGRSGSVRDCVIERNRAGDYYGGISAYANNRPGTLLVSNCIVRGNAANWNGGGYCVDVDIWHTVISNNTARASYGGIEIIRASNVVGCLVAGNTAPAGYGGISVSLASLRECIVRGNVASNYAGLRCDYSSSVRNCLVMDNVALSPNGMANYASSSSQVENCTFSANVGGTTGVGGLAIGNGNTARNCIFYYNTPRNLFATQGGTTGAAIFANCCVPIRFASGNNITNEPAFADRAARDFHLLEGSPCAGAGTNQPWMAGATDLDGNPRIAPAGAVVDMGCYEGTVPEPRWSAAVMLSFWLLARLKVLRRGTSA